MPEALPETSSGLVNQNKELAKDETYTGAVSGLERVEGGHYAGGFGGKVYAGGLADAGGISLLGGLISTNMGNLVSLLSVYRPLMRASAPPRQKQSQTELS